MARLGRDRGADALLDLDGQVFALNPKGEYVARFVARRVEPSPERPHGLNYSLTLHGPDGRRLLGFDNAHAIRPARKGYGARKITWDHKHKCDTISPYEYESASQLLEDFWREVESITGQEGKV